MRWPHSDKEISPQNAVGVGMSTTLHMPIAPAACSPWTQAFMVEALPQKKQSWWISTTACGDFQPKIFSERETSRPNSNSRLATS